MRLALYYPWLYLKGGAERTILNLVTHSRHTWTIFTNHYDPESTFPEFQDLHVVQLGRVSVRRSVLHAGHAAFTLLTQQLPIEHYKALMVTSESLGNLVTIRSGNLPLLCLCLTPLRVAYDPVISGQFAAKSNPLTRAAVSAFRAFDRPLWRRYQQVFSISQEVTNRLLAADLVEPDRIRLVRPGVDTGMYTTDLQPEPFFLLPGRIMWTKNIELGIDGFLEFKRRTGSPFRLVVAGMVDRKSRPYIEALRARAAPMGGDVEFWECPSDWELRDLYARCTATLFTALNEDWGLVPLESMASGRPVLAVDSGGPRESVQHERTGLLLPPDVESFAAAMARLAADPALAAEYGRAGRLRANAFTWGQFSVGIDGYCDGLAARPLTVAHAHRY